MTDRELLERAAKAAGIEVWFPRMADGRGGVFEPCHRTMNGRTEEWNPLVNDGDALRLAVKLRLSVYHAPSGMVMCISADGKSNYRYEPDGTDPNAATRRAIVRAAAAALGDAS